MQKPKSANGEIQNWPFTYFSRIRPWPSRGHWIRSIKTNYLGCPCGHFKSHGFIFPKRHFFFSFNSLTYWISHDGKEWRRNDSLSVTSLVYWMTHARCIVIGHHRGEWKSLSDYTTVVSISETYQNLKHQLRQNFKEKYLQRIFKRYRLQVYFQTTNEK